jgi:hypothetical protein
MESRLLALYGALTASPVQPLLPSRTHV